ncbi:MAG: tetratricopeptide repeat protein [Geobacteraceae bacterium]|nr:MAG: tetratricopeptide repeat protein [Geobacteraceae bacterium]
MTKKKGAGLKHGAGRKIAVTGLAVALVVVAGVSLWQFFLRPVTPTIEKADPKQMALPLPELPSIAVMPFVNLSEDSKQQLLCDGITDNIINALSKVPQLFVIARNSTFTYKDKAVKAKQVSEELGVRYVLEGSVQRSDDRVRITAQLVDALTGNQLLAERYDSESTDLFALQDDLTFKVLEAVRLKLTDNVRTGQGKYFSGKLGLDCYMKALEAVGLQQQLNIADNNRSRQIVEECLAMCPEAPTFYRLLGGASLNDYFIGSSKSPQESIEKAKELFQKAISMDERDFMANAILSHIYSIRKENDKAISQAETAVELAPGSSWAIQWNATALTYAGRYEEAIPLFEKAIRLNPSAPTMFYLHFGHALRETGRLEEAVMSYKKAIERAPKYVWPHAILAAVYSMMGRDNEAHAAAAEVLRLHPKFSLEWVAKTSLYKDPAVIERVIVAMRKAGLPDKPPPAQP